MDAKAVERVRRGGYLPIAVSSLDASKIVLPIPTQAQNAITTAALETILQTSFGPEIFGKKIANLLK